MLRAEITRADADLIRDFSRALSGLVSGIVSAMEWPGVFVEAARPYQNNPVAMHLRAMNMLYEGLNEKGSMIIVPSTAVESMNLGAMGGLTALSQAPARDNQPART